MKRFEATKKRYTLDRIEEGFAVCFDGEEREYSVSAASLGLKPNDIFLADYDAESNEFYGVEFLEKETEAKKAEMQERLNRLFGRNKKQ